MTGGNQRLVFQQTQEFLEERSDAHSVLEIILEVDATHETWSFEDISLDSGTFGEVVARDIVEKHDGQYRIADREAVEAALNGREIITEDDESEMELTLDLDVNYRALAGLFGALVVVMLARMTQYSSVFWNGRVVSPANDPYFYRYWQEQLLAQSSGPFSLGVLIDPIWDTGNWNQRPLTHATNWWITELLGGTQAAAELVAAWLPIVLTLVLCLLVYYLALVLTGDARVGIASVVMIGLAPVHVNYTSLGMLHHRSHHLLYLGALLVTLVWLAQDIRTRVGTAEPSRAVRDHISQRKTWGVAATFGLSVALYVHSWGGSAELFVPLIGYIGLRIYLDVRDGLRPALSMLPVVFGIGLGAGLAMGIHLMLGWHGLLGPALAVVGFFISVFLVGLAELWYRYDREPLRLVLVQPVIVILSVLVVLVARPSLRGLIWDSFGSVLAAGVRSPATQAESLFSTEQFVFFGPFVHIGAIFFVACGALIWSLLLVKDEYEPGWLVLLVFTLYYLVAAGLMLRFAVRLVVVMAVFGGAGLVYILAKLDLAAQQPLRTVGTGNDEDSQPSASSSLTLRKARAILVVAMLLFGLNLVFIPTMAMQTTHDEMHLETAAVISDNAESLDRDFPQNAVFAPWKNYRMYNYFVSGNSEDSRYARLNYEDFIEDPNPDEWYENFQYRLGYVVYTDALVNVPKERSGTRLTDHLGAPDNRFEGLEHYRLVHLREDDDIAVFAVVPGAPIEITANKSQTVTVKTNVSVSDRRFSYERELTVGDNETASMRVPYPGEYEINGTTVIVDTQDVEEPQVVEVQV